MCAKHGGVQGRGVSDLESCTEVADELLYLLAGRRLSVKLGLESQQHTVCHREPKLSIASTASISKSESRSCGIEALQKGEQIAR